MYHMMDKFAINNPNLSISKLISCLYAFDTEVGIQLSGTAVIDGYKMDYYEIRHLTEIPLIAGYSILNHGNPLEPVGWSCAG